MLPSRLEAGIVITFGTPGSRSVIQVPAALATVPGNPAKRIRSGARVVLRTRLRFATLLVFAEEERYVCGYKDLLSYLSPLGLNQARQRIRNAAAFWYFAVRLQLA